MFNEESYRSWQEFETQERRRVATFQMSVDNLAKDLYLEINTQDKAEKEDSELSELNFDY